MYFLDEIETQHNHTQILSDHKILSAPVYDAAHKKDLGIIDVMDFVFYALDNMNWESPAIYFSTDVLAVLGNLLLLFFFLDD
jgi:hypothetical protein